jgi:oxygen-independent coproporphyrinogen-3 oxidase
VIDDVALTADEEADEMLLMGLRLVEGIDLDLLAETGGRVPSDAEIARLADLGLVVRGLVAQGPATATSSAAGASEIAACIAPGMGPSPEWSDVVALRHGAPPSVRGILRVTPEGRFVLNEIVRRLSNAFVTAT